MKLLKLFSIFLLISVFLSIPFIMPSKEIFAQTSRALCSTSNITVLYKTKVDSQFMPQITIAPRTAFTVQIKISNNITDPTWEYYPVIFSDTVVLPTGLKELSKPSNRIRGSTPANVGGFKTFEYELPGIDSVQTSLFNAYLQFSAVDSNGSIKHICYTDSQSLKIDSNRIFNVPPCDIVMSENFKKGTDQIKGTIQPIKPVEGIYFLERTYRGRVAGIPTLDKPGSLVASNAITSNRIGTDKSIPIDLTSYDLELGPYTTIVWAVSDRVGTNPPAAACAIKNFNVTSDTSTAPNAPTQLTTCSLSPSTPAPGQEARVLVNKVAGGVTDLRVDLIKDGVATHKEQKKVSLTGSFPLSLGRLEKGTYSAKVYIAEISDAKRCEADPKICKDVEYCSIPSFTVDVTNSKSVVPPCKNADDPTRASTDTLCSSAAGSSKGCPVEKTKFGERTYISTAIGCVPTDPNTLINSLMTWAAGFAGGIALLLMISGSYQMVASQGNPDSIKKGREQFVSAVIGLLFIIFSVTLLRIIGVDILQIPGFKP